MRVLTVASATPSQSAHYVDAVLLHCEQPGWLSFLNHIKPTCRSYGGTSPASSPPPSPNDLKHSGASPRAPTMRDIAAIPPVGLAQPKTGATNPASSVPAKPP